MLHERNRARPTTLNKFTSLSDLDCSADNTTKARVLRQVPVEHVELGVLHGIQESLHLRLLFGHSERPKSPKAQ